MDILKWGMRRDTKMGLAIIVNLLRIQTRDPKLDVTQGFLVAGFRGCCSRLFTEEHDLPPRLEKSWWHLCGTELKVSPQKCL